MSPNDLLGNRAHESDFLAEFEHALSSLRGALIEALGAVGADPTAPQAMSRALGVNRNMAWKLAQVVNRTDPCEAVHHLPRRAGFEILLRALEEHGAPPAVAGAVRDARAEFDRVVQTHAGSRGDLEAMLASMLPTRVDPLVLESSRKLAFQGQSTILGVRAKTRFAGQIVAPDADDAERVDIATISGHVGFRRLRADTRWPLMHEATYGDAQGSRFEPIDPDVEPGATPFMLGLCQPEPPSVEPVEQPDVVIHELMEGPVGSTGAFTYAFGRLSRSFAPVYGDEPDDVAELSTVCETPAEDLVFDLLLHRALPVGGPPRACIGSLIAGRDPFPLSHFPSYHLPGHVEVRNLGPGSPVVTTPRVPGWDRVLTLACERLGHPLADFRAHRVALTFPPVPTRIAFHYPLAPRPKG